MVGQGWSENYIMTRVKTLLKAPNVIYYDQSFKCKQKGALLSHNVQNLPLNLNGNKAKMYGQCRGVGYDNK